MPLYEFRCKPCGVFDVWRSLAESSLSAHCPACNQPGQRIFTPPMMLSSTLRLKRENREPQVVSRDREISTPRVQQHTGSRPWMIGH